MRVHSASGYFLPAGFFVKAMTVNQTQLQATQREIPLLGEARKPVLADWNAVKTCTHRMDAIRLCVQLSDYSHEMIASTLGINKGHWSRMMQGRAHFPDTKSVKLMELCGNYAPLQYEAWACGFELVDKRLLTALRANAA